MNDFELRQAVLTGQHVLITGGVASGKTQTLAKLVNQLVPDYFCPRQIAALAVTRGSVGALQAAVTPVVRVGTVHHAAHQATGDRDIIRAAKRDLIRQRRGFLSRYLDLLRQVGGVGDTLADRRFLNGARGQIRAALRLESRARLAGDEHVLQQWALDPGQLAPGFVTEVADRYNNYKQEFHLYDSTDLQLSATPDPEVRVVLIDDAEDLNRADLEFLARVYPDAVFVFAGNPELRTRVWEDLIELGAIPHMVSVALSDSKRIIETWTIDCPTPFAGMVPHDVGNDVLIILGARRRHPIGRWVAWCMDAGLAFRLDDQPVLDKMAVRDIAAMWRCDRGEEVHPARLDRLARTLGEPAGTYTCSCDFRGWTDWRDMAMTAGYPEHAIDYADALLTRYGTLDLTEIARQPMPHIVSVNRCKGLTADVVVIDGFSMAPQPNESDDSVKLRWQLATSRARRQLIVLQSETNTKQRQP